MNIGTIHQIPINETTAYLAGVIVGDGHIFGSHKSNVTKSKDYRITVEVIDLEFLKVFESLIKSIISTKSTIRERKVIRGNRKQLYYFQFRNKSFYYFLTSTLKIPSGKKSSSVIVPLQIYSSLKLQKFFLAGLFDTDGGIRGKTLGFTSASKDLIKDVSKILLNLEIKHYGDSWINNKYGTEFYGLRICARDNDKFLNGLPMKNKRKQSKCFCHVGVPEWSNGLDNS